MDVFVCRLFIIIAALLTAVPAAAHDDGAPVPADQVSSSSALFTEADANEVDRQTEEVAQTLDLAAAGTFTVGCAPIGRNDLDVIVAAESRYSHYHEFWGNNVPALDQNARLPHFSAGKSSCIRSKTVDGKWRTAEQHGDYSGYWVPSLVKAPAVDAGAGNVSPIDITTRARPSGVSVYYWGSPRRAPTSGITDVLVAFPPGLKLIAGNSKAVTAAEYDYDNLSFGCSNLPMNHRGDGAVICGAGMSGSDSIAVRIEFPSCWDGLPPNLFLYDSNLGHVPDQRDTARSANDPLQHVAYPITRGNHKGCFDTKFPLTIPKVQMIYQYPVQAGTWYSLASHTRVGSTVNHHTAPWWTIHADFFNAWNPAKLEQVIATCLRTYQTCKGSDHPPIDPTGSGGDDDEYTP